MLKTMISGIVAKNLKNKLIDLTIKEEDISEVLKQIRLALLDADVNLLVVKDFIKKIRQEAIGKTIAKGQDHEQFLLTIIKQELITILGSETKEITFNSRLTKIMLVGLQGSGKTTSAAKLAKYIGDKKSKNCMLVALDVYRPAAIDQLETLAKEVGCEFYCNRKTTNVVKIAQEAMDLAAAQKIESIIFDTAGRLQTDETLMDELRQLRNLLSPQEMLLVVDAMAGQDIINVAKEFHDVLKLSGLIITKLDSQARAGATLSITHSLNIPVKFSGTGEKINALDLFKPERIANQILGLGDVMTLAEKASEAIDEKESSKSMARMLSGKFDFEDLLSLMGQINKIGDVGSIIKMVPGAGNISSSNIEVIEQKMFVWRILLSSMTKKERRNPQLIKKHGSRRARIIMGSGRKPDELNKLIKEWEKWSEKLGVISSNLKKGKNPFNNFQSLMRGK